MNRTSIALTIVSAALAGGLVTATAAEPTTASSGWDARAAAAYLDGRQAWWMTWSGANRDHDTQCVSCHTALPYALARPALRGPLGGARSVGDPSAGCSKT